MSAGEREWERKEPFSTYIYIISVFCALHLLFYFRYLWHRLICRLQFKVAVIFCFSICLFMTGITKVPTYCYVHWHSWEWLIDEPRVQKGAERKILWSTMKWMKPSDLFKTIASKLQKGSVAMAAIDLERLYTVQILRQTTSKHSVLPCISSNIHARADLLFGRDSLGH